MGVKRWKKKTDDIVCTIILKETLVKLKDRIALNKKAHCLVIYNAE
jgi:hypothetical protein